MARTIKFALVGAKRALGATSSAVITYEILIWLATLCPRHIAGKRMAANVPELRSTVSTPHSRSLSP